MREGVREEGVRGGQACGRGCAGRGRMQGDCGRALGAIIAILFDVGA